MRKDVGRAEKRIEQMVRVTEEKNSDFHAGLSCSSSRSIVDRYTFVKSKDTDCDCQPSQCRQELMCTSNDTENRRSFFLRLVLLSFEFSLTTIRNFILFDGFGFLERKAKKEPFSTTLYDGAHDYNCNYEDHFSSMLLSDDDGDDDGHHDVFDHAAAIAYDDDDVHNGI